MTERIISEGEQRCSNCMHGGVFSAGVYQYNGYGEKPTFLKAIPAGQTRNCFTWWQTLSNPKRLVYLKEDDACINSRRFKLKINK